MNSQEHLRSTVQAHDSESDDSPIEGIRTQNTQPTEPEIAARAAFRTKRVFDDLHDSIVLPIENAAAPVRRTRRVTIDSMEPKPIAKGPASEADRITQHEQAGQTAFVEGSPDRDKATEVEFGASKRCLDLSNIWDEKYLDTLCRAKQMRATSQYLNLRITKFDQNSNRKGRWGIIPRPGRFEVASESQWSVQPLIDFADYSVTCFMYQKWDKDDPIEMSSKLQEAFLTKYLGNNLMREDEPIQHKIEQPRNRDPEGYGYSAFFPTRIPKMFYYVPPYSYRLSYQQASKIVIRKGIFSLQKPFDSEAPTIPAIEIVGGNIFCALMLLPFLIDHHSWEIYTSVGDFSLTVRRQRQTDKVLPLSMTKFDSELRKIIRVASEKN